MDVFLYILLHIDIFEYQARVWKSGVFVQKMAYGSVPLYFVAQWHVGS